MAISNRAMVSAPSSKGSLVGPSVDRDAALALDLASNLVEVEYPGGPLIVVGGLPDSVRRPLVSRMAALVKSMLPMAANEHGLAGEQVRRMLSKFGGPSIDAEAARGIVAGYVEDCADLPLWALRDACGMLCRGEVAGASLDYRPASARVRDTARRLLEPIRAELDRVQRVLNAKPVPEPDPAMKARIGALLAELAENMRRGRPAEVAE